MNTLGRAKFKMVLYATLFLSLLMTLSSIFIIVNTSEIMQDAIAEDGAKLAFSVALLIERDIEEYAKFTNALDAEDPYYLKMNGLLNSIKQQSQAKYIYTEYQLDSEHILYVLDAEIPQTEFHTPPGYIDIMNEHSKNAHSLKEVYKSKITDYPLWGKSITSYAPIMNRETGEYHGLVGVDYSYEYFSERINGIIFFIIIGNLIIISVIFFILMIVASLIANPLTSDHLTKLSSKLYFEHMLKKYVRVANKKNKSLTIFIIDVDDFKQINDKYGHLFGDMALYQTAQTIRSVMRETDCVGRFGGDEFVAVLFDIRAKTAYTLAERICDSVASSIIQNSQTDDNISVTVSIGIAEYRSSLGYSISDVMEQADLALYQAKKSKNKASVYAG